MKPSDLKRFLVKASDDAVCRLMCLRAGTWSRSEERALLDAVLEIDRAVIYGAPGGLRGAR
jgi:hypothetical protein